MASVTASSRNKSDGPLPFDRPQRRCRIVAIDDEPLALRRLERLIADIPDCVHVGSAASCHDARRLLAETSPDLLLLDIHLRDGNGFELLPPPGAGDSPMVIFVTAFDSHAVKAFEHAALDYLLKPVEPGRLQVAVARALDRQTAGDPPTLIAEQAEVIANLRAALRDRGPPDDEEGYLWVRSARGALERVMLGDIMWISSEDDYIRLHGGSASYLVRSSIASFQAKLVPERFVRVHRTALVRLSAITSVHPSQSNCREVLLHDATRLPVGRIYYRNLCAALDRNPNRS